jgi:catechol-2,3-dioxygenase
VLRTARYTAMVDFYRKLLGARIQMENGVLAFLAYDDEHHRVAVLNIPGLVDQPDGIAGVHHIAFTYASLRDLVSTYERVERLGIKPIWCTNHGPTTSMYYADPDGNQLELQVDNFDSVEEADEFMQGGEFRENPIGVDFDPAELARRIRAGESETVLKKRAHIGPRGFDSSVKIR